MSVIRVEPIYEEQTGSWDRNRVREYVSAYLVTVDSWFDGPSTVLNGLGLSINTTYGIGNDNDSGAFLQKATPKRVDGQHNLWIVTVNWGTPNSPGSGGGGQDSNGNPTDDPNQFREEIEFGPASVSRPAYQALLRTEIPHRAADTLGPVTNSAGTVLDPPYERSDELFSLRISKYRTEVPNFPISHLAYSGKVNSDEFPIIKPGLTLLIPPYAAKLSVSGSLMYQNNLTYWKLSYELLIDYLYGWRENIPDRGFKSPMYLNAPNGRGGYTTQAELDAIPPGQPRERVLTDEDGQPLPTMVNFNGEGFPLDPRLPPVYLTWSMIPEVPFVDLNL